MLKDHLYSIVQINKKDQTLDCSIHFNASDPIFEGHFPDHPVVPGVCLVQIVRELAEIAAEFPLTLRDASQIKFLNPIDPGVNPDVFVKILLEKTETQEYRSNAIIYFKDEVFMKFKGVFETDLH